MLFRQGRRFHGRGGCRRVRVQRRLGLVERDHWIEQRRRFVEQLGGCGVVVRRQLVVLIRLRFRFRFEQRLKLRGWKRLWVEQWLRIGKRRRLRQQLGLDERGRG
jgi:hypothetical protein